MKWAALCGAASNGGGYLRVPAAERNIKMERLKILELFGGIGSPRCALRNLGIPVKSLDYVEVDIRCVDSYNAMFAKDLGYKAESVVGWNFLPDVVIHGSPCQSMSCAGHQGKARKEDGRINRGAGADKGSGTPSSLMWETVRIIRSYPIPPRVIIWENVENVLNAYNRHNFKAYCEELEAMGYTNSFAVLDARDFELPQARKRVITISIHGGDPFNFGALEKKPMRSLEEFLLPDHEVPALYDCTQPCLLNCLGAKGIRRTTVIDDYAMTITCRQDRSPAQVIDRGDGRYRFLTELECWRLMGYTDADYFAAQSVQQRRGKFYSALYKQAGNSIPVTWFEAIFKQLLDTNVI